MNNQPKNIKPCTPVEDCKPCNQKTKVYSRVVGYIRPVEDWNIAKQQEFRDRKPYTAAEKDPSSSTD